MKFYYYTTLVCALLLGSCSQQQRITKTPGSQPNTVATEYIPATEQVAATPKQNNGETFTNNPRDYYEDAYTHLQQMLHGEQPLDFKKAVFITENAWCEDKIPYDAYNNYINALASECKAWKKANKLKDYFWEKDSTQVALNGAVYHVMTDTIRDEKRNIISTPYHYDFDDCFAKDNWTNMFVTKLMATDGGNCHSLPFLYKILAEELGTEAYLCFLPGHIYINQYSQKTSWYNTELTGRCFPVDAWLMTTGYVSVQSMRTGLYMDTLSLKQSVAVCVNDLAKGYERKFGDENYTFILKCCNLGLAYYPNYGELLLLKAETLKKLYQRKIAEYGLNAPDSKEYGDTLHSIYAKMEQTYNTLTKLDYREIPDGLYSRWTNAMINGGKAKNENIHDSIVYTDIGGKKQGVITVCYGNNPMLFNIEDTVRRIGSVIFNTKRHKVEYFILKDDYAYGDDLTRPTEPARFLSPDPIAKQFPQLTPYQYASNTPILSTDIDGEEAALDPNALIQAGQDQTTSGSTSVLAFSLSYAKYFFLDFTGIGPAMEMIKNGEKEVIQSGVQSASGGSPSGYNKYVPPDIQNNNNVANAADAGQKGLYGMAQVGAGTVMLAVSVASFAAPEGRAAEATGTAAFETTENAIVKAASDAVTEAGEGSGAVYGTKVHTILKASITEMKNAGADIHAEVSYLNKEVVDYGTKGSIRVDVAVGDVEHPTTIYDLKTGGAKMSASQLKKYWANLPASVKEIKVINTNK